MTKTTNLTAQEWKENGNVEFNKGNWSEALSCYTSALKLANEDNSDKAIYYKNRAATYLKQEEYNKVIEDCDKALKICPNDPKALFRRCQALEALERYEEAYRDARYIISADPGNKAIQSIAARLHEIVQERYRQNSRVNAKVCILYDVIIKHTLKKFAHNQNHKNISFSDVIQHVFCKGGTNDRHSF